MGVLPFWSCIREVHFNLGSKYYPDHLDKAILFLNAGIENLPYFSNLYPKSSQICMALTRFLLCEFLSIFPHLIKIALLVQVDLPQGFFSRGITSKVTVTVSWSKSVRKILFRMGQKQNIPACETRVFQTRLIRLRNYLRLVLIKKSTDRMKQVYKPLPFCQSCNYSALET